MKAIIVCVDYHDFLAVTLPYNRHHFDRVLVVTSHGDRFTPEIAAAYDCDVYKSQSFYADGAKFNKYAPLEEGLNLMGRDGWVCIMDADVLWPKHTNQQYEVGNLYVPKRRMMIDTHKPIPHEVNWLHRFPLHYLHNTCFSGYTQIFNASDPVLPNGNTGPWHQTNWRHAGGADTFFSELWPPEQRIRPNWECLHLGEAGKNWCGRSTKYLNGSLPDNADQRANDLRQFMEVRNQTRSMDHERIIT